MSEWHGGKGSAPRKNADQEKYRSNWDKIFGNKNKDKKTEEENKNTK